MKGRTMKGRSWKQILILLAAVALVLLNRAGIINLPQNEASPAPAEQVVSTAEPESTPSEQAAAGQALEEDEDTHWGNPKTLQDHFDRHGADFKAKNPDDYARQAHAFFLAREQYQVKVDTDGSIRVFDPKTRAFAAYNRDGTTKTFFKPSDGQAYFDHQPGK